jgi:DNA-directed RNA polymerase specialized sigma24 family protein
LSPQDEFQWTADDEVRARAITRSLALGENMSSQDLQLLRTKLRAYLRRTSRSASAAELDDIVDASIEKFLLAARAGRVQDATSLAYLRRIARNEGIDQFRRRQKESPLPEDLNDVPQSDDAIARLIDAQADARTVEAIQAEAARARDFTTTRVINAYLNLAQQTGSDPSHRLVAEQAGVSHTTVGQVLARLKERLENCGFPE